MIESPETTQEMIWAAAFMLPKQAILENFVHHNPRENMQYMGFFEAHEKIEHAMQNLSPSERMLRLVHADPRIRANAAACELCAVFLDRGVAKWGSPHRDKGFLYFFASLEDLGHAPWRKHARAVARRVLDTPSMEGDERSQQLAEDIVVEHLTAFGAAPEQRLDMMRALFFDLPGWGSMFERMEKFPIEGPEGVRVRLHDFAAVMAILHRSSIEAIAQESGVWNPASGTLASVLSQAPLHREKELLYWQNPSALAWLDQNWDEFLDIEKEFTKKMLGVIQTNGQRMLEGHMTSDASSESVSTTASEGAHAAVAAPPVSSDGQRRPNGRPKHRPSLQVFTCIDERECSMRRHFEGTSVYRPGKVETFGYAGFYDLPMRYTAQDANHSCILAPEGRKPTNYLIEVSHEKDHAETAEYNRRRKLMAHLELLWENASFCPLRSLFLAVLFPISILRLIVMCFFPKWNPAYYQPLWDRVIGKPRTDFKYPFTIEELATQLGQVYNNVGLTDKFAPVVVILGHGSRTVNNPFDAAHNCGACGGREGGPNGRLLARASNDKDVRRVLKQVHGVDIPDTTWFVGGYHDTASDNVELFDVDPDNIPASHVKEWQQALECIKEVRGKSAMERCEKFMLAQKDMLQPETALLHAQSRGMDLGEARPELGHATNACVIVGPRGLTKDAFLARRCFLPSYDPWNDTEDGENLRQVITPAIIVCSGISLEYLFSTVEGGAGTKVALNIVGEHGVMQGASGDLRIGLPTQMTELHSPCRALYVVDAPIERVKKVLAANKILQDIVHNEWINFYVRDPATNVIYKQQNKGDYVPVKIEPYMPPAHRPDIPNEENFVPFKHHLKYTRALAAREAWVHWVCFIFVALACVVPIFLFDSLNQDPLGAHMSIHFTLLTLTIFIFSRRYLHGEFMFDRLTLLHAGLLAGFNVVATAPTLRHALVGWNLMGWTWTFMVGAFSDRPTVRDNATFVFFVNQASDVMMIVAAAFGALNAQGEGTSLAAALCLVAAAMMKTSQFPVLSMFQRCMEGASPSSALGDAALCANAGMVLLLSTMPYWFPFMEARVLLASVGGVTAVMAGLIAQVRSDRKGSLGYATAATLGVLYCILAAGYAYTALFLTFGHAAARVMQFLRSHNMILEHHMLRNNLQDEENLAKPKVVSEWLFRIGWRFNRFSNDPRLPHMIHMFPSCLRKAVPVKSLELGRWQQYMVVALLCVIGGCPFVPLTDWKEELLIAHFQVDPVQGMVLTAVFVTFSTGLMWIVFNLVLGDATRFRHKKPEDNFSAKVQAHAVQSGLPTRVEVLVNGQGGNQDLRQGLLQNQA